MQKSPETLAWDALTLKTPLPVEGKLAGTAPWLVADLFGQI